MKPLSTSRFWHPVNSNQAKKKKYQVTDFVLSYGFILSFLIGLTPIDVAFLQSVIMNAHLSKSVETEVYLVTSSEDEFIRCYLDKMEENKEGRFQRSKRAESLSLKTFLCERHEKPRGKSQGNPSKTRANSCKSYVSFKFTGDGIRKACLVRKNTKHSGHCLDNRQEWKVNRIHPNLIAFIKKLSKEGLKKEEIVTRVKNWSLKNQVADCIDRRFYPTSQDIRYLMTRVPRKKKTHEAEASIATLSKMESEKDEDSRNVDSNSETSEKTFGVGMKWQSEGKNPFLSILVFFSLFSLRKLKRFLNICECEDNKTKWKIIIKRHVSLEKCALFGFLSLK